MDVDAQDAAHGVFHAHLVLAATPGPLTLTYPAWIPGEYGPSGPIQQLTGLRLTALRKSLVWRRDVAVTKAEPDLPGLETLERLRGLDGWLRERSPAAGTEDIHGLLTRVVDETNAVRESLGREMLGSALPTRYVPSIESGRSRADLQPVDLADRRIDKEAVMKQVKADPKQGPRARTRAACSAPRSPSRAAPPGSTPPART